MSSLPITNISKNSNKDVQVFFDTYFTQPINFSDNDLTSVQAFFESRGFDSSSAIAVSIPILKQAKADKVKVFELLDSLRSLGTFELSEIVAEILNYSRKRTSVIGFKKVQDRQSFESRNIIEGTPATVVINTDVTRNFSATGFTLDSDTITWDGE